MLVSKTPVKELSGKIIGFIDLETNGDKVVRDFYGRILGRYDKRLDVTRDFYGRIVARGDHASLLIGLNQNKK